MNDEPGPEQKFPALNKRLALRAAFGLAILIAVMIPVALAEIYLRYIGLGDPLIYYTNASYRYAVAPNQKERRLRGVTVTIDSKGLRGTKDWSAPADYKVLFVGDSVTYGGSYIGDKDTFAEVTCTALAVKLGRKFTCGNAGVNNYGTDNMAARIRYKDFDDETAVVITLIPGDVLRGLTDIKLGIFHVQKPGGMFKGLWEASVYILMRTLTYLSPENGNRRDTDDMKVAKASLSNLFAVLHDTYGTKRKVLIVFSPESGELGADVSPLTRLVRNEVAKSGFSFLDMTDIVAATPKDKKIYYDNVHLDVDGHRLYGEKIASALRDVFEARP